MQSNFGLTQKIWTGTKRFATCERTRHKWLLMKLWGSFFKNRLHLVTWQTSGPLPAIFRLKKKSLIAYFTAEKPNHIVIWGFGSKLNKFKQVWAEKIRYKWNFFWPKNCGQWPQHLLCNKDCCLYKPLISNLK